MEKNYRPTEYNEGDAGINSAKGGVKPTELSEASGHSSGTEINPIVKIDKTPGSVIELSPGTMIGKGYRIIRRIGEASESGEADLYLCEWGDLEFAVKLYRRKFTVKEEIIRSLQSINCPSIAHLFEVGEYCGHHFEVYKYFSHGSLADLIQKGVKVDSKTLEDIIIPNINEALNQLHKNHILHRDIKPANMMLRGAALSDGIAIIDFGLSSALRGDARTMLVSKIGFTPMYAAPEVSRGLYLDVSDYYSMGIVLYELFCGKLPFSEEREGFLFEITKPRDMPERLYNLIVGLTYFDLRHRHDKTNPNRRWGYDEVCRWLKGETLPAPGEEKQREATNSRSIPRMYFAGNPKAYDNIDSLCYAMGCDWESGRQFVFRDTLYNQLSNSTVNAVQCREWASFVRSIADSKKWSTDVKLAKILYGLAPDLPAIMYKDFRYNTLAEFGNAIFTCLDTNQSMQNEFAKTVEELLQAQILSAFAERHEDKFTSFLQDQEAQSTSSDWSKHRFENLYIIAYRLSGKDDLDVGLGGNRTFRSIDDLKAFLVEQGKSGNYDRLYKSCELFLDNSNQLKPKVYAWLLSKGCNLDQFNN